MDNLKPIKIGDDAFELDVRGWMCPFPKYVLEVILPKLAPHQKIDLLVDCPGAITDVPADAAKEDWQSTVAQISDGEWRITLYKNPV